MFLGTTHCRTLFLLFAVMLVLGLGLKAKFCGLGLGLRGLALAKNSRPKFWPTTMFSMNVAIVIRGIDIYTHVS